MSQAAEQYDLQGALNALPASQGWVKHIIGRLDRLGGVRPGMRVLEIGSAQGRGLIALDQMGFDAVGVEPWAPAIEVSKELARHEGASIDIRLGRAEALPFDDNSVDCVIAMSVMEHVTDLQASLSEICRVLRPGGYFWFNSASAMCPKQAEIRGFPGFGVYPDAVKKGIMYWAMHHRPELIGHTKAPALHWWTHRNARQRLTAAGFGDMWTRWDLHELNTAEGAKGAGVRLIRRSRVAQRIVDTFIPDVSYAARKPL